MGKETVLADSGREGEIADGVGMVRSLDLMSLLLGVFLLSSMYGQSNPGMSQSLS